MNPAIKRAMLTLSAVPDFGPVEALSEDGDGNCCIRVEVRRILPSRLAAKGQSPSGVRSTEPVTFRFPADYPLSPPRIHLRSDFPAQRFHYTPDASGLGSQPCLTAEPLKDYFHSQGLAAVCFQLKAWLEKAGVDRLVNAEEGWEPNPVIGGRFIVSEEGSGPPLGLREQVERVGYFQAPRRSRENNTVYRFTLAPGPKIDSTIAHKHTAGSVGIHIAPAQGSDASHEVFELSNGFTLQDLRDALGRLGQSVDDFDTALVTLLMKHVGEGATDRSIDINVPVILDVLRPYRVTGTDSEIERLYFTILWPSAKDLGTLGTGDGAFECLCGVAFGATDTDTKLRLSGLKNARRFALGGSGSLGSAMGGSLARAGWVCSHVADPDVMLPHNQVRHTFLWSPPDFPSKTDTAVLNLSVLGSFPSQSRSILDYDGTEAQNPNDFILHTTASPIVLEQLVDLGALRGSARLVDTELYQGGKTGMALCEGPGGNPSCLDMKAIAYFEATKWPGAFNEPGGESDLEPVLLGGGCGTTTMIMSDAQLAMTSGALTVELLAWGDAFEEESFASNGHGFITVHDTNRSGTSHSRFSSAAFTEVPCETGGWTIRLSPDLIATMETQAKTAGAIETGGYLIGEVNERRQEIICVASIPPPPDSCATAVELVLGTEGVQPEMERLYKSSGGRLLDVGTWHTHLKDVPPSAKDDRLTQELARTPGRTVPSVMLVKTPLRFHAKLADPAEGDTK